MLQNFNDNPFLFLADLRHAVKRLIALNSSQVWTFSEHGPSFKANTDQFPNTYVYHFLFFSAAKNLGGNVRDIYILSKNEIDGTGEEKGD